MLTVLRPRVADRTATVAGGQGEQRVVLAAADAVARVELGAALPDDDLAGLDDLAAEALDAQALGVGVATVAGAGCALFVCHVAYLTSPLLDAGDLDLGQLSDGAPAACGSRSCS